MSINKSYYRQIDNTLYKKKLLCNGNEVYKVVNEEMPEVQWSPLLTVKYKIGKIDIIDLLANEIQEIMEPQY